MVAYVVDRRDPGGRRDPATLLLAGLALVLGALLFAGSLAEHDHESWPGIVAGAACAALGFASVGMLLARARRRLAGGDGAGALSVYGDLVALALAALAIFVQPVGILALVAFAVLLVRSRAGGDRKYEGLRVLR